MYKIEYLLEKDSVVWLKFYFFLVLGMGLGSEAAVRERRSRSLQIPRATTPLSLTVLFHTRNPTYVYTQFLLFSGSSEVNSVVK